MKIAAISDLHGFLPYEPMDHVDVAIIAGDICPSHNHATPFQFKWVTNKFRSFLGTIDADKIFIIPGNHDYIFEHGHIDLGSRTTNLHDAGVVEYQGFNFYGSAWSHTPGSFRWAYTDRGERTRAFQAIPHGVDVLVTHSPPKGILDCGGSGSKTLWKRCLEVKPKINVFGHIHEGHGVRYKNGTLYANVSRVNESYQPIHTWTYLTLFNGDFDAN